MNDTFTANGDSRAITNLTVFKNEIQNVSVANSTNNSNFVTGILWDMSDENIGEYNGSQDLVFVTRINPAKQGAYGVYDYEIKIPSELKKYKKTDINTVIFYVELK